MAEGTRRHSQQLLFYIIQKFYFLMIKNSMNILRSTSLSLSAIIRYIFSIVSDFSYKIMMSLSFNFKLFFWSVMKNLYLITHKTEFFSDHRPIMKYKRKDEMWWRVERNDIQAVIMMIIWDENTSTFPFTKLNL